MVKHLSCVAIAVFLIGSVVAGPHSPARSHMNEPFAVEFTDCVESIGVGLIPTQQVQPLVPAEFHLVGEGQPVTPLVVRTARCGGIAVAGQNSNPGSLVQIGVVIVPPDFSGDINNYTLWYYTSDSKLAHKLQLLGVEAQHVPTLDYEYVAGGGSRPLFVDVPRPGGPRLTVNGTVIESTNLAGSFQAIWWAKADDGRLRMDTLVPQIFSGGADLILTTAASGALGQLIGGTSTGFPILQQFNTFPAAHMGVSTTSP